MRRQVSAILLTVFGLAVPHRSRLPFLTVTLTPGKDSA
jgi:hypothetical protein